MKIESPWQRLEKGRFWQAVDAEHNRLIISQLEGCRSVLDLGCGYGSLTAYLTEAKLEACGVDAGQQEIEQARQLFPGIQHKLLVMDAISLDFPDNRFDGVVLRDTLHHLWEEDDIEKAFAEIERVLKPGGRLVLFDPNPNFVVKTSRLIIRHRDAECTFREANALLERRGWTNKRMFFTEFFALALSGGYVGVDLTPRWPWLHRALISVNRAASNLLSRFGLGPALLWRYVITAESPKRQPQSMKVSP